MLSGSRARARLKHLVMALKRFVALAAILMGECAAFAVALVVVMRSLGDVVNSWWLGLVILGAVYLLVGAVPIPPVRQPLPIGIAGFLVPLLVLGWIDWRVEYFLMFEHVGAWENLPRVMLGPDNLGAAAFLCVAAVSGRSLSRRIFRGGLEGRQQGL